jgi:sugar lactone lactonase YvrE
LSCNFGLRCWQTDQTDGLTVDSEGFLWSAQWYGSCVVRYDPDGKVERRIITPAKQTSCMTFGGANFSDLFITSAARSEAMPIMPPDYDPNTGFFGARCTAWQLAFEDEPNAELE